MKLDEYVRSGITVNTEEQDIGELSPPDLVMLCIDSNLKDDTAGAAYSGIQQLAR